MSNASGWENFVQYNEYGGQFDLIEQIFKAG